MIMMIIYEDNLTNNESEESLDNNEIDNTSKQKSHDLLNRKDSKGKKKDSSIELPIFELYFFHQI